MCALGVDFMLLGLSVPAYPLCAGTIQQAIHAYSPIQPEYSHTGYSPRHAARVRWLYGIHPYSSYTIHAYSPYTIQPHTRPPRSGGEFAERLEVRLSAVPSVATASAGSERCIRSDRVDAHAADALSSANAVAASLR